jgi:hypothetical protein
MQNQATGRVVYYPDGTVMTWFEHATETFERRVSGDLQGPWRGLIRECFVEGTRWYVVGHVCTVESA